MDERHSQVSDLLQEAAETHHRVFRISDGTDDDWASWYANWLVTLSELPELLAGTVVRSELTWLLVRLDKEYTERRPDQRWQDYYAEELFRHFSPGCIADPTQLLQVPVSWFAGSWLAGQRLDPPTALAALAAADLVHPDPATGTIAVAYPFSRRPTPPTGWTSLAAQPCSPCVPLTRSASRRCSAQRSDQLGRSHQRPADHR